MDVTASSSLNAMAAGVSANNPVELTMLRKALDVQTSSMTQLLQTLPTPPQAAGKGAVVDTQA